MQSRNERAKRASDSRKKAAVAAGAVAVVACRVAFDIGAITAWIVYKLAIPAVAEAAGVVRAVVVAAAVLQ